MPGKTTEKPSLTELPKVISAIFDQAQVSAANHNKNWVALHKIHATAAENKEKINNGRSIRLTGERAFGDAFIRSLTGVLPVKKGVGQADRAVKFISGYTKFIIEKSAEEHKDADEDSVASRFTARLLRFLFKGFLAKDKSVRYRVLQLIAEMIAHLGEIDDDVYKALRESLIERIHDKEASIRVQAAIALSKLSNSEDPSELNDGEPSVLDILSELLAYDSSAEVRRAVLLNLPITEATLPNIIARTRDTDNSIRKLVYSTILEPNVVRSDILDGEDVEGKGRMGLTHPRALTISQRESVVRNGLGDREPSVRNVAANLLGVWVDEIEPSVKAGPVKAEGQESGGDKATKIEDSLASFLRLFDLTDSTVAEEALLSIFNSRPDIFQNITFGDDFWTTLNPERALLARVFAEHCVQNKEEARHERSLPVVTALAFCIQSEYNALQEAEQAAAEEDFLMGTEREDDKSRLEAREEIRLEREFVIGETLRLAVTLDFSDEIGRRKMFQLIREMISQPSLPDSLVSRCLDVLRELVADERDLIRVVVEVVHDLRDPPDEEDEEQPKDSETNYAETPATVKRPRPPPKPVSELTPEESARADAMDLRCLSLCIGMLERVNSKFEENSTLDGVLADLIIPSVKRKEMELREKGLVSLGLCCLIAKRMALNSFTLFLNQIQPAPEALRIRVLQIVFDILMVHDGEFLGKRGDNRDKIVRFLLSLLSAEESDKVQALLCKGIAKLMLAGMIVEEDALAALVKAYFSPSTAQNQELRQCLSYFFPVYCYSSPVNQRRMKNIFLSVFNSLGQMSEELEEDQEMISAVQVAGMLVDWTDAQNARQVQGQIADEQIHLHLAEDIVKELYKEEMLKDEKKALCAILGKLYLPENADDDKLRTLKLLILNLPERRSIRDASANKALSQFDAAISKKYEKQLRDFSEEEMRKLEQLKDLFEFLDDMIPLDDEEEQKPKGKASRKRRSRSETGSSSDRDATPKPKRGTAKPKPKRQRLATPEDGDQSNAGDGTKRKQKTRSVPKRSAAKKPTVIEISSDSDEEEGSVVPSAKRRIKEEVDVEVDELDDDEEEEEEEGEEEEIISGLLAT